MRSAIVCRAGAPHSGGVRKPARCTPAGEGTVKAATWAVAAAAATAASIVLRLIIVQCLASGATSGV